MMQLYLAEVQVQVQAMQHHTCQAAKTLETSCMADPNRQLQLHCPAGACMSGLLPGACI